MQKYKCHKVVEAFKIAKISISPITTVMVSEPDENNGVVNAVVRAEWVIKFKPAVGGYYVQYADGYASYSPAEAFEEGYTRMEDGN